MKNGTRLPAILPAETTNEVRVRPETVAELDRHLAVKSGAQRAIDIIINTCVQQAGAPLGGIYDLVRRPDGCFLVPRPEPQKDGV